MLVEASPLIIPLPLINANPTSGSAGGWGHPPPPPPPIQNPGATTESYPYLY